MTASPATVIEQYASQFKNLETVVVKLAAKGEHHNSSVKENLAQTLVKFTSHSAQTLMEEAANIVGHAMIVTGILTSASPGDESTWAKVTKKHVDYAKTSLHFDVKVLPRKLKSALCPASNEATSKNKRAVPTVNIDASTSAGADSDVASAFSVASSATAAVRKNKLRKFG